MDNESLSEVLESATGTEETAPAASSEETVTTEDAADSSLKETAEKTEDKPSEGIDQVRAWGKGLETDLNAIKGRITEWGGESQLQIMTPFLRVAQEIPSTPQDMEEWSPRAWESLQQTLLPEQAKAMKDEAAWSYLTDPASAKIIAENLYPGTGVTPEILREFAQVYAQDPEGVMSILRPGYSDADRRAIAAEQAANELKASIEAKEAKAEAAELEKIGRDVTVHVLETGLSPRAEIKKQFGLEFQQNANDTPEIARFKQSASDRYDKMVMLELMNDSEMNRLSNAAQHLANQKDPHMRERAVNEFAPLIQQRARALCAEIAKDLAEDLKFFGNSDQTKVNNLKDLKPNVLGATAQGSQGFDLSGMPSAIDDPVGHANWVAEATRQVSRRGPALMQGG